jgi:hypothetical protein
MPRLPRSPRVPDTAFADARLAQYTVVSDLPEPLPITERELELLETELSDFIEELLSEAE